MDKKSALETITGIILSDLSNRDHEVGNGCYEYNSYCYDGDGWTVELTYRLQGDWHSDGGDYYTPPCDYFTKVWGDVDELSVVFEDDVTGECLEYSDEELKELKEQILEAVIDSIPLY